MIKLICLKSIGNFILLPPPMSVCVYCEVLYANLDENEFVVVDVKFTLLRKIPANSQRNIHKWFLVMLSL